MNKLRIRLETRLRDPLSPGKKERAQIRKKFRLSQLQTTTKTTTKESNNDSMTTQ